MHPFTTGEEISSAVKGAATFQSNLVNTTSVTKKETKKTFRRYRKKKESGRTKRQNGMNH